MSENLIGLYYVCPHEAHFIEPMQSKDPLSNEQQDSPTRLLWWYWLLLAAHTEEDR